MSESDYDMSASSSYENDNLWTVVQNAQTESLSLGLSNAIEILTKSGSTNTPNSVYKIDDVTCISKMSDELTDPCNFMERDAAAISTNGFIVGLPSVQLLNRDCTKHICSISLDGRPELVAFNRDSTFVVIGDSFGYMHFVHVETGFHVFSQAIHEFQPETEEDHAENAFKALHFTSPETSQTEDLLVVLKNHILYRFSNINLSALQEALQTNDTARCLEIKNAIELEETDLGQSETSPHQLGIFDLITTYDKRGSTIIVAGKGNASLSIWRREFPKPGDGYPRTKLVDTVQRVLGGVGIVKLRISSGGKFLLALDEDGDITVWDRRSLIMIRQYHNTQIADFDLLPSSVVKAGMGTPITDTLPSLIALSKPDQNNGRQLQIISLNQFHVTHRMPVSDACWLVRYQGKAENCSDSIYFIEGVLEAAGDGAESISHMFVRSLSETLPLTRFQQLILNRKYTEAEAFAEQYGLDLQVALKAKLTNILNESFNASGQNIDGFVSGLNVDTLIHDLSKIEDDAFVIDFALQIVFPNYQNTYKLLAYARSLVYAIESKKATTASSVSVFNVHQAFRRLGTWQLIGFITHETPRGIETQSFNGKDWQAFRTSNMVEVARNLVAKGRIKQAMVIWRRHHIDEKLVEHVDEILCNMPDNTPASEFISWIRNEIMMPIQRMEDRVKLATWIEQRARLLELKEKKPHNALEVIRLLENQSSSTNDIHVEAQSKNILFSTPATPARYVESTIYLASTASHSTFGAEGASSSNAASTLRKQLEDLVYLWDKHDFRLSLSEYSQESPSSIAMELLDRVAAPELLADTIEKHFKPYAEKNELSSDDLLVEYCMEVMDNGAGIGKTISNAPWEIRVLSILECIASAESRLDVVLELMRRTPVPWSETIDQVILKSLDGPTLRRTEELREQYRLMQLKSMLLRYGIKVFNISDLALAKGLVSYIAAQVDVETAMDDALQVVHAYHHLNELQAYVLRIQNLCSAKKFDRILDLLDGLVDQESKPGSDNPQLIAYRASQEALVWLIEIIESTREFKENDHYSNDAVDTFKWAIEAAVVITKFLNNHSSLKEFCTAQAYEAYLSNAQQIHCLATLFKEYEIILTIEELQKEGAKHQIARSVIEKICSQPPSKGKGKQGPASHAKQKTSHNVQTAVFRLSDLLGITRHELKGILAEEAASHGDLRTTFLICKEMYDKHPDNSTAEFLRKIAYLVTKYANEHSADVFQTNGFGNTNVALSLKIQQLAQQATLLCTDESLSQCLDQFTSFELQHSIFAQTENGDYGSLVRQVGKMTLNPQATVTTSSAGGSSSSVNMFISANIDEEEQEEPFVSDDRFADDLFQEHYFETGLVLKTEEAMSYATSFVLDCCKSVHETRPRNGSAGKSKSIDDSNSYDVSAKKLGDYLQDNRNYQTSLSVIQRSQEQTLRRILGFEADINIEDLDTSRYNAILEICVQKVLSSRYIDNLLALGYTISLPLEQAFTAYKAGLATVGSDYHRLIKFAAIGIGCATVWEQRGFYVNCKQLGANARWWHQLKILDIPFDDAQFRASKHSEYQRKLVPLLMEKTNLDILTVLEFGRAYDLEDDYSYLEYVRKLILCGPEESYQSQVVGVVDDIVNKEKLLHLLISQCVPRVSPYDYERLQFIFQQIIQLLPDHADSKTAITILDILMNYTRLSTPALDELSDAVRIIDGAEIALVPEDIPELRKRFPLCLRRVPFHTIIEEPWKILKYELTEETIPKLLPLTLPLGIHPDQFYGSVIDNLLAKLKLAKGDGESEPAEGYTKLKFTDFKGLILKIRDTELAISSAKYVADGFACGVDKIQALKTAVHLSDKWLQKINSGAENEETKLLEERASVALGRLKDSLARTETEHQLRSVKLTSFLHLVPQPLELICQLYAQQSEEALANKDSIDVHHLTSEIAVRHSLDIDKVRQYLLTTWLTQDLELQADEVEICLPSMRIQANSNMNSRAEISLQMRILYLLQCGVVESNIGFLLNFAYQQKSTQKVTTLTRVRSLSVLFQLASPQEIARVHNYQEVRAYLQMLLYLADFEDLRISQTLKEFNACDKEAFARSLWVKHSEEPKVVQLVCNLCVDYKIHDMALWESALHKLIKFRLYNYLLGIIEYVSLVPELSQMPSLPQLWNDVLKGCFESVLKSSQRTKEPSPELESTKNQAILLLQKCPFFLELDLPTFFQLFDQLGAPELVLSAYCALPMVKPVKEKIRTLVDQVPLKDLVTLLDRLNPELSKGHLEQVSYCINKTPVIHVVYDRIEDEHSYEMLLHSKHLKPFIGYLIDTDQLENLVLATLEMNQESKARELVQWYYKKWTVQAQQSLEEDEGRDILDIYLESKQLIEE
ncbi:hypothetical protein K493DRAFT_371980 [Basidiobolus meristosporus CBS 931.73]|uniref:Uncharacterized protein n=1 Tax=Basidiobolus meristosporus CBS 931.73 TaxID=1314790 RepID=A0A1Y1YCH8_9FUNG|nr:hypothetical protein K493DRAFT_371980 [Basidiobolus meristosporus CBS 931.73]|eukprot:ORX95635.1 hypothetical protein K493DRAFT_371980 [Basidiobolus meristosporus CBS 931.73]